MNRLYFFTNRELKRIRTCSLSVYLFKTVPIYIKWLAYLKLWINVQANKVIMVEFSATYSSLSCKKHFLFKVRLHIHIIMMAVNCFACWVHLKWWQIRTGVSGLEHIGHHYVTVQSGKFLSPCHCKNIIIKVPGALFEIGKIFVNLWLMKRKKQSICLNLLLALML